jgi:hypothetical protein
MKRRYGPARYLGGPVSWDSAAPLHDLEGAA